MRNLKTVSALGLSAILLAASVSSADADWHRHGYYGRYYGHGPGLVGGVVIGALTLATLPFAILGAATSPAPPPPPPPPPYYGPRSYGYGPPPPPAYYRRYGPPPGYYGY